MSLQRQSSSYEDEILFLEFLKEEINILGERASNLIEELSSKSANSEGSSNEYKVTKKPNSKGPIPKTDNRRKISSAPSSSKPSGNPNYSKKNVKTSTKPSDKPSRDAKNDSLPKGFGMDDCLPDDIDIKKFFPNDVAVSSNSSGNLTDGDFLPDDIDISTLFPNDVAVSSHSSEDLTIGGDSSQVFTSDILHDDFDFGSLVLKDVQPRTVIYWKDVISGTQNPRQLERKHYDYLSRLFRNPDNTNDVLPAALNRAVIYQVIGNGFCGFNALIALVHIYDTIPKAGLYSYPVYKEMLEIKLNQSGFGREIHNNFDIREVLRFSEDFFDLIELKNFVVICINLDEQTSGMTNFGVQNMRNTFVIIYKGGHFDAMYFKEEDIEAVYHNFIFKGAI